MARPCDGCKHPRSDSPRIRAPFVVSRVQQLRGYYGEPAVVKSTYSAAQAGRVLPPMRFA